MGYLGWQKCLWYVVIFNKYLLTRETVTVSMEVIEKKGKILKDMIEPESIELIKQ